MRKKIYLLAVSAVITGAMLTACAPKAEATVPATEAVSQESEAQSTTGADNKAEQGSTEDSEDEGIKNPEDGMADSTQTDEMLTKVHEAVKTAYGDNYIPNMAYDATALKEVFGVSSDLYDSFIAEGPMISVNVETFIGIKAKPGKAGDAANALESYKKSQLDAAAQYPMNMVKLQASQVLTYEDYVFFVMLGAADQEAEEAGETEALESAKKNNQIAVDAIEETFKN